MKKMIFIILMMMSGLTSANAATAYWTGSQKMVQTVTYQWVWECEYRYLGNTFYQLYKNSCPSSVGIR